VYNKNYGRFALLSISDSSSTDPLGYVTQNDLTWSFGASDEAGNLYKVQGYPTTVFIDKSGNIVETQLGGMEQADFEAKLAKIL
jgi:thioredoxin-related protein